MSELQISVAPAAGAELELVDAELVSSAGALPLAAALSPSPPPSPPGFEARNLFAEAERIAARAASAEHAAAVRGDLPRLRGLARR